MKRTEEITGYVVDIACLRKYPQGELLERSRRHTTDCALMDHCIESGYGLVDDNGLVHLMDSDATPRIVETLRNLGDGEGIRLRGRREMRDGEMKTVRVEPA